MGKFDALFEDESDIFAGTPQSKYWDIAAQLSNDLLKDEFDRIVERLAAMEAILSETHDYNELDRTIRNYALTNFEQMEELKKSVYMELAGQLIYRVSE
jgi:flagellar motor switch protein FliM